MPMAQLYNHGDVHIELKYDQETDRMRVLDSYGEFIPFPRAMWNHFVERPWFMHFRYTDRTYQWVVETFIGDYKHRYICFN